MHFPQTRFRPLPLVYRVLSVVLIIGFLLIGLIGLVLPIIPGIVFLLLAVYLLTRISRRAAEIVHRQPWYHRGMRDFHAAGHLSVTEKIKLSALMAARAMVNGVDLAMAWLRSRIQAS